MAISDEEEAKLWKLIMYIIGTIIIVFFLTVGGCTMHGNAYEADVEKEMTAQELVRLDIVKANQETEREKMRIFEQLVKDGANPVAVRCGMDGWKNTSVEVCLSVGVTHK